jgi:hypothetical protein
VIEWLDDFYNDPDLRSSLLRSLAPLFAAYALDVWRAEGGAGDPPRGFVAGLAASYADHHLNSSRIQLQEVVTGAGEDGLLDALRGRFAEWTDKRPGKVAANETVRAGNAIALERMRSEGVVTKRWATSGSDSCPYCTSLDGTVVEIERPFFTPADSYQPQGAETPLTFTSDVGHPPVHQGCVCSVVPG